MFNLIKDSFDVYYIWFMLVNCVYLYKEGEYRLETSTSLQIMDL